MNNENLKPIRTTERAKELGRKGGIASGEKRRKDKEIRDIFKFADISSLINFARLCDHLNESEGRKWAKKQQSKTRQ